MRRGLAARAGSLRTGTARRIVLALVGIAASTSAVVALSASPASATGPGTLNPVNLVVSNNAANATGSGTNNSATYTWEFTTDSSDASVILQNIVATVPPDASGTPTSPVVYGVTGCSVTAATLTPGSSSPSTDGTVDFALTGCNSFSGAVPVVVTVAGIENGSTLADFETTVSTYNGTYTPGSSTNEVDTGTATTGQDFNSNTTAVNILIPESLTFTNDTTSIYLAPIPGGSPVNAAVSLSVSTNLTKGFDLSACASAIQNTSDSSANGTIPEISSPASALNGTQFGAEPTVTTTHGSAQTNATDWPSGEYAGYASSCADSGQSLIFQESEQTSSDVFTITNAASASSDQEGGTYQGTISYLVTPKY